MNKVKKRGSQGVVPRSDSGLANLTHTSCRLRLSREVLVHLPANLQVALDSSNLVFRKILADVGGDRRAVSAE